MTTIDVRCPVSPKVLFMRLLAGEDVRRVPSSGLIEVACRECRNERRRRGLRTERVLHRYNDMGEHVETEAV